MLASDAVEGAKAPQMLFEAKLGEYDSTGPVRSWDISPDGRRFLPTKIGSMADARVTTIHTVLNWTAELAPRGVGAAGLRP